MKKTLHIAISLSFLAGLGLSGCGVKGQLQRPADAPKEAIADETGKKPHKPNVLDALL